MLEAAPALGKYFSILPSTASAVVLSGSCPANVSRPCKPQTALPELQGLWYPQFTAFCCCVTVT